MNSRTLLITVFSLLIGTFIALYVSFFSGMHPLLGNILVVVMIGLFLWSMLLLVREPNKTVRGLQFLILVLAIGLGVCQAKASLETLPHENPRRYFQKEP